MKVNTFLEQREYIQTQRYLSATGFAEACLPRMHGAQEIFGRFSDLKVGMPQLTRINKATRSNPGAFSWTQDPLFDPRLVLNVMAPFARQNVETGISVLWDTTGHIAGHVLHLSSTDFSKLNLEVLITMVAQPPSEILAMDDRLMVELVVDGSTIQIPITGPKAWTSRRSGPVRGLRPDLDILMPQYNYHMVLKALGKTSMMLLQSLVAWAQQEVLTIPEDFYVPFNHWIDTHPYWNIFVRPPPPEDPEVVLLLFRTQQTTRLEDSFRKHNLPLVKRLVRQYMRRAVHRGILDFDIIHECFEIQEEFVNQYNVHRYLLLTHADLEKLLHETKHKIADRHERATTYHERVDVGLARVRPLLDALALSRRPLTPEVPEDQDMDMDMDVDRKDTTQARFTHWYRRKLESYSC